MTIIYSSRFERAFKGLSKSTQILAHERELLFRNNIFDERLKTHKLRGRLEHYWSFSLDFRCRIIFEFLDENTIVFHNVGDHGVYK